MARLVQPQRLTIRPVERLAALPRQFVGAIDGLEGDEAGLGLDAGAVKHAGERHPLPRDDHRPGLDTAEAVDPLFARSHRGDLVQRQRAGALDQPADLD